MPFVISDYEFSGCTSLASIAIPDIVTNIGSSAFSGCTSLTTITIPSTVTSIPDQTFLSCSSLTSVMIPGSVTSLGSSAFANCASLTSVTIPGSVTSIGDWAFVGCASLARVTIGNGLASIGYYAFADCTSLTNIALPTSVTTILPYAFALATNLAGVYFAGDAPPLETPNLISWAHSIFLGASNVTVYYLPGTTGWGLTFGERPTALWSPQVQTSDGSFGVQANQFGFNIVWASGRTVVVEACTNLVNPAWLPLETNTLTGSSVYFSDPQWMNYPGRFYRITSP